jgi:hypothetical protein
MTSASSSNRDLSYRVTTFEERLGALIPTLATKADIGDLRADLHKEIAVQTWKIFIFVTTFVTFAGGALTAAVYFIATHTRGLT